MIINDKHIEETIPITQGGGKICSGNFFKSKEQFLSLQYFSN